MSNGQSVMRLKDSNKELYDDLRLNRISRQFLDFLINIYDDGSFIDVYWDGSDKQVISIMNYRNHVRENVCCPIESEFIRSYSINKKNALEILFLFPIYDYHIELLEEQILQGKITLSVLYQRHLNVPNVTMVKLISGINC